MRIRPLRDEAVTVMAVSVSVTASNRQWRRSGPCAGVEYSIGGRWNFLL